MAGHGSASPGTVGRGRARQGYFGTFTIRGTMRSADLPRYQSPSCTNCRTMMPECFAPWGDGTLALCWLCAHALLEHGATLGAPLEDCSCSPADVYPPDVQAARLFRAYRTDYSYGPRPPEVPAARPTIAPQRRVTDGQPKGQPRGLERITRALRRRST